MNIIVPIKQVPDLVEELELNDDGTDLDREYLSYVMNEFDEQALEEAVLTKEAVGGTVTAVALDMGEADQVLYTAGAKGADILIKITGDFDESVPDSHGLAQIIAGVLEGRDYDAIFTGVQAPDDLDGQLAPLLAARLNVPHVSVVAGTQTDGSTITATQEFGGGVTAELKVPAPCVLGIQVAKQAPRYAPISKVRAVQKEMTIEEVDAPAFENLGLKVRTMSPPESTGGAEMIKGSEDEVADKVVSILKERGLVKA